MFFGLIGEAFADSASSPTVATLSSLLPMLILALVSMYFFVFKPQNKRHQEQLKLLESLKVGDEIETIGGLIGVIAKISEQYVTILVHEKIKLVFRKDAVARVLPKGVLKDAE